MPYVVLPWLAEHVDLAPSTSAQDRSGWSESVSSCRIASTSKPSSRAWRMKRRRCTNHASLSRIVAVKPPFAALMVTDHRARFLCDKRSGANIPVPLWADGNGRIEGSGRYQSHAVGQRIALREIHVRPRLVPLARLHQAGIGQKFGLFQLIGV